MIKIHDKLWYVKTKRDWHSDKELAYMTHFATDASFDKRVNTGTDWAGYAYGERNAEAGIVIDNKPIGGFYIGSSVSRWSTSNKLFRVVDPRGFVVEVPTDNIATLLHHTTVVKGVVDCECVWGREGNNHILLPVNSEPYLITLDQMDTLENKLIPLKDLKKGDWFKMFEDKNEYYYYGKVKITWNVRSHDYSYGGFYGGVRKDIYGEWHQIKDNQWVDIFLYKYDHQQDKDNWYSDTTKKPKITKVIKNELLDISFDKISIWAPQRITNQVKTNYWHQHEIVSVEFKN